jgi:NAD(P)-dependent dehydrogenase (short-subunit alcohol dehydrogenase family)
LDRAGEKLGPVAIITGASRGIGRALALELGSRGYRVGLIARRARELDAVASMIAASGGVAVPAVADVGDRGSLRGAVAEIEGLLGPVDVMVANAGFGAPTQLDPLNTSDVEQTFRVNLMGVIYSIEAVLPGMLARRRGHLLAISSLGAFKGLPGESAYCASKAAVNAYMEGMRIALRSKGVVVTTVCPGFVDTPMTAATIGNIVTRTGRTSDQARSALEARQPIGRLITPEEVAGAVWFCVASESVTGQAINVDGGTVQS